MPLTGLRGQRPDRSGQRARAVARGASYRRAYTTAGMRGLILPSQRGYVRTSGFYGRYAGAGAEKKFFDTTKALTTTATAGTIFDNSLNIVPEGNGESDRVGRKITIKDIYINGNFKIPSTATAVDTSDCVRIIVYQDKQTNGAAAVVTDILASADFRSWNNLSNKNRFLIHMDKKMAMAATAGSGRGSTDTLSYGENQRWWKMYKSVNIPIEYDSSATTGAITTQRSNNVGVLVISESAKSSIGYIARIRYTDA